MVHCNTQKLKIRHFPKTTKYDLGGGYSPREVASTKTVGKPRNFDFKMSKPNVVR